MVHVQATIPFLPANAPVGTQVPGFSTMPEKILQYRAEFSPTTVSVSQNLFDSHENLRIHTHEISVNSQRIPERDRESLEFLKKVRESS